LGFEFGIGDWGLGIGDRGWGLGIGNGDHPNHKNLNIIKFNLKISL